MQTDSAFEKENFNKKFLETFSDKLVFLTFTFFLLLAYGPSIFSDFIGDDLGRITFSEIYYQKGLMYLIDNVLSDRPLTMLTLWLNYQVSGLEPMGYKLVNLALHLGCAFFIFKLLLALLEQVNNRRLIAFFASLLFLVHPINNVVINSVVQRGTSLSVLLSVISFLLFIDFVKQEQKSKWFLSLLFFGLSLLAKPNTFLVPALMAMYSLHFDKNFKSRIKYILVYLVFWSIPVLLFLSFKENGQQIALSSLSYFLVQTKVLFLYFIKYLLPFDMYFMHPLHNDVNTLFDYQSYLYLIAYLAFFGLAFAFYKKNKNIYSFFIILGFINLAPESTFFSIVHVLFYHRNYFVFIFFMTALLIYFLKNNAKTNYKAAFCALVVMIFAITNNQYNLKTNTYEKWMSYNFKINPTNKNFYTYSLFSLISLKKENLIAEKVAQLKIQNPADQELDYIQEFANYQNKNADEKKLFLTSLNTFLHQNQISSHFITYCIYFFPAELQKFYGREKTLFAVNSFYFTHIFFIQKAVSNAKSINLIKEAFVDTVKYYHEKKSLNQPVTAMLELFYLRSLVVLKYFFNTDLNFENLDIAEILKSKYLAEPETAELLKIIQGS